MAIFTVTVSYYCPRPGLTAAADRQNLQTAADRLPSDTAADHLTLQGLTVGSCGHPAGSTQTSDGEQLRSGPFLDWLPILAEG